MVGYGRLVRVHAYRQLDELSRAFHWSINAFQPSMKLIAKRVEGRTIHRIYDTARTPLQRVLLSGVLPSFQQQELCAAAKALDPLRLFQQVEQMQQATFRCEAGTFHTDQPTPELRRFDLARCAAALTLLKENDGDEPARTHLLGSGSRFSLGCKLIRHGVVGTSFGNSSRCFLVDMQTPIYARFSEGCARSGPLCSKEMGRKAPQKNAKNTRFFLLV
ncbi:MAG TPA: hypothetical protein VFN35_13245 [Ktedonobacteraceae bacterium]|nr:hypothetical protein [Ktedonobacteraceae bacterium]